MVQIKKIFPKGKRKAFTLSYDDGITQDKRLVEIFNKYNLKATFNLNAGLQSEIGSFKLKDLLIKRMNAEDILDLYKGHEIANHGLTHLSLTDIPKKLVIKEILEDRQVHEEMFGVLVRGMAYPYGTYNNTVLEVLKLLEIAYSRTVNNSGRFDLPKNYLEWNPTAHHKDPHLMEIAERFVKGEFNGLGIFYLWGHSYEFDLDNNWQVIERLCKYISNREDIWYATNIEIVDYLEALDRLKYSASLTFVHNPSAISTWIEYNGVKLEIEAGETKRLG